MSFRSFLKFTAVGRIVMIPFRFALIPVPCLLRQIAQAVRWAFVSKEYYNHTYHLTDLNESYLASYVSLITGADLRLIEKFINELKHDQELKQRLYTATLASKDRFSSDLEPRYGRRLGWYAIIRATKPRVVVETGIDRGLGTVVMAAALKRNADEGAPGVLYATDILSDCGHLVVEPYKPFCRELIGDSVKSLELISERVDIFLHDSDHRAEYEAAEFNAIERRLSSASIVLSDNSQQTAVLRDFAKRTGRAFLYFQDQPRDHWWPGDGIGCAFFPGKCYSYQ